MPRWHLPVEQQFGVFAKNPEHAPWKAIDPVYPEFAALKSFKTEKMIANDFHVCYNKV